MSVDTQDAGVALRMLQDEVGARTPRVAASGPGPRESLVKFQCVSFILLSSVSFIVSFLSQVWRFFLHFSLQSVVFHTCYCLIFK